MKTVINSLVDQPSARSEEKANKFNFHGCNYCKLKPKKCQLYLKRTLGKKHNKKT